jgi:hypothetical protein
MCVERSEWLSVKKILENKKKVYGAIAAPTAWPPPHTTTVVHAQRERGSEREKERGSEKERENPEPTAAE